MADLDIRILNNPHAALIGAAAYYEDMQQSILSSRNRQQQ